MTSLILAALPTIDLAYNAGQAWATKKASEDPRFFTRFDRERTKFLIGDALSLVGTAYLAVKTDKIIDCVLKKIVVPVTSVLGSFISSPQLLGLAFLACLVGTISLIVLGVSRSVKWLNQYYKPSVNSTELKNMTFDRPNREIKKQELYVARIVMSVVLVFFSPQSPFFALSAAFEIYSLLKVTERKWVEFKKEMVDSIGESNFFGPIADKISVSYSFLMRDAIKQTQKRADAEEYTCSICLEEKPPRDIYFCDNHSFHSGCIVEMLENKSDSLGGFRFTKRNVEETRHYLEGVYTHSTYSASYSLNAPESNCPSCPNCREKPAHNEFTVRVHDLAYGWSPATINWV